MITHPDQIPFQNTDFVVFPCERCSQDTANVCARCGVLKHEEIHHVGCLPDGAHEVLTGECPSWKMLRIASLLCFVGGILAGVALAL